jgi:hypothetical protein
LGSAKDQFWVNPVSAPETASLAIPPFSRDWKANLRPQPSCLLIAFSMVGSLIGLIEVIIGFLGSFLHLSIL